MILYVSAVNGYLHLFTKLPSPDRERAGDLDCMLIPGESFGGLSYEELLEIAATSGSIDAERLRV